MTVIKMDKFLFILLFFCPLWSLIYADTLSEWSEKFSRMVNPIISEDGRWVAIRKRYESNQDTLMIINPKRPNEIFGKIVLNGETSFFKDSALLVSGNKRAEFWNLKTGVKSSHVNVKIAYPLNNNGGYGILDNQNKLNLFDLKGKPKISFNNVIGFPVNNGKSLYFITSTKSYDQVNEITLDGINSIYSTSGMISKIQLSQSSTHLILTETSNKLNKILFYNILKKSIDVIPSKSLEANDYFTISEIQNGKLFLITINRITKNTDAIADIWYSNDNDLHAKKRGIIEREFWIYNSEKGIAKEVANQNDRMILALNNQRYFLSFTERKDYNYLTSKPQINDAYLYDLHSGNQTPIGAVLGTDNSTPEIVCSPDGNFVITKLASSGWTLFDLESQEKLSLDKNNIVNPVFTTDGNLILFEGNEGIWQFNLKSRSMSVYTNVKNSRTEILNTKTVKLLPDQRNIIRSVDTKFPILIKVHNLLTNKSSVISLNNNNKIEIVNTTANKVRSIVYDPKVKNITFLEENFNMPPKLYFNNGAKLSRTIFEDKIETERNKNLKQDIITFETSNNKHLKAVLYYPNHYNPAKKYPMVVHIYGIQSDEANSYQTPGYDNPEGLDIRMLVEKGYFVLLPDIDNVQPGVGFSALECVHKALDKLNDYPSIDKTKIGLIGHSFGGYETDFIATQSDRFATFISGAGDSDIINSYFSYNYHFPGPHYWQFENGQYKMPEFSLNKDLYYQNNPINYVENVRKPILLWTGQMDENVPWNRTMEFYIGLKRNYKTAVAIFYKNGRHAFLSGSEEKKNINQRIFEWWDYFLKDKKDIPWITKAFVKNPQ